MDAPLISHQRNRNQREHYDQDNALFAFRKNENPNQVIHFARNGWDLLSRLRENLSAAGDRNRTRRRQGLLATDRNNCV